MNIHNDLDYFFAQQPNIFGYAGKKQQGRKRNYVERDPSAVSNYTRAASAQFMKQYADPTAIARSTQEAVNRVNAQRRGISEEQARKNYKAKKGSSKPDYINRNSSAASDYTRAISQEFVRQHTQDMVNKAPKSSRAAIKARQRQLKEMGLYEGAIDGKWGPLSIAAHNAATAGGAAWVDNKYVIQQNQGTTDEASLVPLSIFSGKNDPAQTISEPVGDGSKVFYIHYPDYSNHSKNTMTGAIGDFWNGIPVSGMKLPVGHDAVILADKNGKTRYYEYGRINSAPEGTKLVGKVLPNQGNIRRASIPDMNPGESASDYIARIKPLLPYADAGKINVSVANGSNMNAAVNYINKLANDPNRDPYSLANTCATFASTVYNGARAKKQKNHEAINALRAVDEIAPTPGNIVRNVLMHGPIKGIASVIPNTTHWRNKIAKIMSDDSFTVE